mmetsp:Transcript_74637/g.103644  ORF Transcript_74637/g.103644 Transcript_74637/m.103644 type:complete len:104 (+) Transcript_74637:203-514(+)
MVNDMVVQKYIARPLLIDNLKFDLRVYIAVVGVNPINAFMSMEGLARFCTEPYEFPTKKNFKDFFKHLTNYSINKHHQAYTEDLSQDVKDPNQNTKRSMESLF